MGSNISRIKKGPNKGDVIIAKAKNKAELNKGHWWPVRVVLDRGGNSTLRDNPGVKFSKKKRKVKKY